MNYWWFLMLLIPVVCRPDIVFFPPALTLSEAEFDQRVKRGNEYTSYGLEVQGEWIGHMLIMFIPCLILAVCGATYNAR